MATTTNISPLKINFLTQAQYNTALTNNNINENELYLTPASILPEIEGGTGQSSWSKGDLLYAADTNTLAKLNATDDNTKRFLSCSNQIPTWTILSKSDVGLGNVENTALSTWTGTNTITTVGTISTGVWQGTAIPIERGGTNAETAAAARTNLGITPANIGAVPTFVFLGSSGISSIIAKIGTLNANDQATFYADATAASLLTDNNVTSTYRGMISRNSSTYDIYGTVGSGSNIVACRLAISGDTITISSYTRFLSDIKFEATDTTAELIYNKINSLILQTTVAVFVPGAVADVLTGGKLTGGAYGTMTKYNTSGSYRFLLARLNGQYLYGFECTITSSAVTPGTVYRYSGTVV